MIAASERSDLIVATLNRALADFRCVAASDATVLLGKVEIFRPAKIALDAPPRALFHQLSKFVVRYFEEAVSANARRHPLKKSIDDFFQVRLHIFQGQVRGDGAHAAVDVEADTARRNDASFAYIHRGDAADWKSIAAMAVRHAKRIEIGRASC